MTSNSSLVTAAILLVVLLAAYGYVTLSKFQTGTTQDTGSAQVANPASTHCIELGGTLEMRETVAGQAGYCHLPDGNVCEEWALFRDNTCTSQ